MKKRITTAPLADTCVAQLEGLSRWTGKSVGQLGLEFLLRGFNGLMDAEHLLYMVAAPSELEDMLFEQLVRRNDMLGPMSENELIYVALEMCTLSSVSDIKPLKCSLNTFIYDPIRPYVKAHVAFTAVTKLFCPGGYETFSLEADISLTPGYVDGSVVSRMSVQRVLYKHQIR